MDVKPYEDSTPEYSGSDQGPWSDSLRFHLSLSLSLAVLLLLFLSLSLFQFLDLLTPAGSVCISPSLFFRRLFLLLLKNKHQSKTKTKNKMFHNLHVPTSISQSPYRQLFFSSQ